MVCLVRVPSNKLCQTLRTKLVHELALTELLELLLHAKDLLYSYNVAFLSNITQAVSGICGDSGQTPGLPGC